MRQEFKHKQEAHIRMIITYGMTTSSIRIDISYSQEGPSMVEAGDREAQQATNKKKKKKRKRGKKKKGGSAAGGEEEEDDDEGEEEGSGNDGGGGAVADAAAADEGAEDATEKKEKKRKKRPKKKKAKTADDGPATAGEAASVEGQAAWLWGRYCELLDVSPLDRDRPRFFDPSRFVLPSPPTASQKESGKGGGDKGKTAVPETGITLFLKRSLPGLQKLASDNALRVVGRPLVVIVSPAAVRANDLAKELRVRLPNQRTAKLFAKHIKVEAQAEALRKDFHALAVGTPNRLGKLIEAGAISLAGCRLLVLDASFRDAKQFTLLTLPGVAKDMAVLLRDHVLPALKKAEAEALKIAMF